MSLPTDSSNRRTPTMSQSTCRSLGVLSRWVPERIWWRLVALGKAYEVHLLPLVPGATEPQFLNAQQVSTLIEEAEFLAHVVEDDLITQLVGDLVPLLAEARQESGDHALDIQGA